MDRRIWACDNHRARMLTLLTAAALVDLLLVGARIGDKDGQAHIVARRAPSVCDELAQSACD